MADLTAVKLQQQDQNMPSIADDMAAADRCGYGYGPQASGSGIPPVADSLRIKALEMANAYATRFVVASPDVVVKCAETYFRFLSGESQN